MLNFGGISSKRAAPETFGGPPAKRGPGTGIAPDGLPNFCLKVLVSQFHASIMIGKGGTFIKEMRAATGAWIHLSGKGDFYPGSDLREVNLQASSDEALQAAMQHMMSKIIEIDTTQSAVMKVSIVVPRLAAGAIIGRGGAMINELQAATGAKVRIEEGVFGAGETAEQVVSISGEPDSAFGAAIRISSTVQGYRAEPWFGDWYCYSLCLAQAQGGMAMMPVGKGYSAKGAGKRTSGLVPFGGANGNTALVPFGSTTFGGGDAPVDPYGAASPEDAAWAADLSQQVKEMATGIPPFLAAGAGPTISFAVNSSRVGGLIGTGGFITKEIAAQTGTKLIIRESENTNERTVIINGPSMGVVSAYLMVVNRLGELETSAAAELAGGN